MAGQRRLGKAPSTSLGLRLASVAVDGVAGDDGAAADDAVVAPTSQQMLAVVAVVTSWGSAHGDGGAAAVTAVVATCAIHMTTHTVIPSASVAADAGDVVAAAVAASTPTLASWGYPGASFHQQCHAFDIPSYLICRICTVDKDPTSSAAWDEAAEVGKAQGV